MENVSLLVRRDDERFKLPAGFRFHPTDEELIIFYLSEKVLDSSFTAIAIGEADLNKCEPWDLPWRAKWGEEEWYFFSVRDRKYPMGQRANRATEAGYWKATGKDKEVFREKTVIGMRKTLVFYKGRAPKGERTNWVMHEYRLQAGANGVSNTIQSQTVKDEWVLCRVFQKNNGGRKLNIPPPRPRPRPPSFCDHQTEFAESSQATCFSDERQQQDGAVVADVDSSTTTSSTFFSSSSILAPPLMVPVAQLVNPQNPDEFLSQQQIMMMENYNIGSDQFSGKTPFFW